MPVLARMLRGLDEGTGTTVIFVTHDIDEAISLSTEIVLMRANPGRMVDALRVELPAQRWSYDVRSEETAIVLHRKIRESLADGHRGVSTSA